MSWGPMTSGMRYRRDTEGAKRFPLAGVNRYERSTNISPRCAPVISASPIEAARNGPI